MTDIIANPSWSPVRILESNELARGGINGNMNEQAIALVNRTEYLKDNSATKAEVAAVGGGSYGFETLAEFEAKKSTLRIDSVVTINEAGPHQGDNIWNGIELKKSPYDPLQQSKNLIEQEKKNRDQLINANLDVIKDKYGFVIADFFNQFMKFYLPIHAQQVITESLETNKIVSQILSLNEKFTITTNDDIIRYLAHIFQIGQIDQQGLRLFVSKIQVAGVSFQEDGIDALIVKDRSGFYGNVIDIFKPIEEPPIPERELVDVTKPLFTKKLAFWKDESISIDVPNLLLDRQLQSENEYVLASLNAVHTSFSVTSARQLFIPKFSDLSSQAWLVLRDKKDQIKRSRLVIDTKPVLDSSGTSFNVHLIGDSILNRGGGSLVDEYLRSHGYIPNFIGTMLGADNNSSSNEANGVLNEGREGWETGDFTYAVTDRVKIVGVGLEQDYMAFDKSTKWSHNPYLRLATQSDDSLVIRNGYVFDFAFYLSRFNLATPDIVYIGLGTNDIRDRTDLTLANDVYSNLEIMIKQIKKAVPNVKIILSIPGTGFHKTRNELWKTKYFPVIRSIQKVANDNGSILMPAWSLTSHESSYSLTNSIESNDPVSGADYGTFNDYTHPQYAARRSIYNALAAYIAAAKNNQI